jgi:signal peptide peptidase SppA
VLQGLASGSIDFELDAEDFKVRQAAASYRERLSAFKTGTVQVIPVTGVLTQRWSWITWIMDGTALDWLREAIREAIGDPEVGAIVLAVDSRGGSVDGLTEFAAELRRLVAEGGKPIVAVSDPMIASGAYWTMCQASEVVCSPSGSVGSIGIIAMHQDISRMLDEQGVTITLIYSGEFKTEGNPFEPLPDEALKQFQSESQHYYSMFHGDVAAGRNVTRAVIEESFGRGRMVFPQEAAAAGMVDRIDTLEATVRRLSRARVATTQRRAIVDGVEPIAEAAQATDASTDLPAVNAVGDTVAATDDTDPTTDSPVVGADGTPTEPTDDPATADASETVTEPDPGAAVPPQLDRAWVAANAAAFDRAAHGAKPAPRWHD